MDAAFELDREQWQRLKAVLTRAMKRSPAQRKALLEEELGDDVLLREYAVDMLQYYDNATRPFDVLSPDSADVEFPPHVEPVQVGDSVSHYRILKKLGAGGMGIVFLAQDQRLGRQVALKFLSPDLQGSFAASKQQLYAESRAVAVLNHPAIVTLHDVFEIDNQFVTVMEYVEGRSLDDLVQGAPMSVGYALRLMYQLADALAYAHGRGIIHCDLKPANIHVLPTGAPKILDFGLARAIVKTTEKAVPSDRPIFGTMGYIAPERLLGREPSAAADMYALGVIFYQLVTGSEPFVKDDQGQLFLDTVTATPLPPSTVAGGIPPAVDDLVLRCLAKSPRERLQPHELARGIDALLQEYDTRSTFVTVPSGKGDRFGLAMSGGAPAARTNAFLERATATIVAALVVAALVTLLGLITSYSYQRPLGLEGPYSSESAWMWPVWGIRSLVAAVGSTLILWLLAMTMLGACRVAGTLSPRLQRACHPLAQSLGRCRHAIQSLPASSQASALLLIQLAALAGMLWRFRRIVEGMDSFLNGRYNALQIFHPRHSPEFSILTWWLGGYLLVFGIAWLHIYRRIRGSGAQEARPFMWGGAIATAFAVIIFQTVPFRVFYHNAAPRVSYAGRRCYSVGRNGNDVVVFCPNQEPPWTTVVKASDPSLKEDGVVENIFADLPER